MAGTTLSPSADEVLLDFVHSEIVAYCMKKNKEEDKKENDHSTIEALGFSCGYKIIERLTKDWPRFKDELDTMKFICTELWVSIYKKQIDNLRTNYHGIYLLQDNCFRFLSKISCGNQYLDLAPQYVAFTCGLIRGALSNLGIPALVTSEISSMPVVKFHVRITSTPTSF